MFRVVGLHSGCRRTGGLARVGEPDDRVLAETAEGLREPEVGRSGEGGSSPGIGNPGAEPLDDKGPRGRDGKSRPRGSSCIRMLTRTTSYLSYRAASRSAARFRCAPGLTSWRGGASGAFETIRGGSASKSVAKAPRDGIGHEKKRGISTFLLARSGSIRAFATDLDNCATRAPRRGAAAAWTATMTSTPTAGWARGNAARPRVRHLTREYVPLADVLAGQVTCSAVTR